jgi:hypothetical protein
VEKKVAQWISCVEDLAGAAGKYPQAAHCAFVKCLQAEWKYLQRLVPDTSALYEPLRDCIRKVFVPELLGRRPSEAELRLFELPPRLGGLGIFDPCSTADAAHDVSVRSTQLVSAAIITNQPLDVAAHNDAYGKVVRGHRLAQETVLANQQEAALAGLSEAQRRLVQNQVESGSLAWLGVTPLLSEGYDLSAQQWRDKVSLTYGQEVTGLPAKCDGCGQDFSVDHALNCLVGGLVGWGHNHLRDTVLDLSRKAWGNAVPEPVVREASGRAKDGESDGLTADLLVRGVWERDRDCFFDTRIINADSPGRISRNISYNSALKAQAEAKKRLYKLACEERRAGFTPLVCTTNGCLHGEFKAFLKRLAARLSTKWASPLSVVTNWVNVRIQFALIKAVDLRLRGSRKKWMSCSVEDGAGLGAAALL